MDGTINKIEFRQLMLYINYFQPRRVPRPQPQCVSIWTPSETAFLQTPQSQSEPATREGQLVGLMLGIYPHRGSCPTPGGTASS